VCTFWDDRSKSWESITLVFYDSSKPGFTEHLGEIPSVPLIPPRSGQSESIPLSTDSSEGDSSKDPIYCGPNGNRFIINKRGTVW
jgi:hypothetical protein